MLSPCPPRLSGILAWACPDCSEGQGLSRSPAILWPAPGVRGAGAHHARRLRAALRPPTGVHRGPAAYAVAQQQAAPTPSRGRHHAAHGALPGDHGKIIGSSPVRPAGIHPTGVLQYVCVTCVYGLPGRRREDERKLLIRPSKWGLATQPREA
jgi:hypothetical protein